MDAHGPAADPALVPLERHDALARLAGTRHGRVVLVDNCIPVALPVNLVVLDGDVYFVTGRGAKWEAAEFEDVVSIQGDQFDDDRHEGWSVLVTGPASRVTDPALIGRLGAQGLVPWVPVAEPVFVRVRGQLVSGREIRQPARPLFHRAAGQYGPG